MHNRYAALGGDTGDVGDVSGYKAGVRWREIRPDEPRRLVGRGDDLVRCGLCLHAMDRRARLKRRAASALVARSEPVRFDRFVVLPASTGPGSRDS